MCGDPRTAIYEARGLKHYKYFNKYSSVKASRPPDATNMVDISALAIRTFLENKFFVSIATGFSICASTCLITMTSNFSELEKFSMCSFDTSKS